MHCSSPAVTCKAACPQGAGRRSQVQHTQVFDSITGKRGWRGCCWEQDSSLLEGQWMPTSVRSGLRLVTESKLSGKGRISIRQVGRDSCPDTQRLETPRLFTRTNRNAILAGADARVLVIQTIQILPITRLLFKTVPNSLFLEFKSPEYKSIKMKLSQ